MEWIMGSPKLPPGPGHDLTFEHQNPEALNGILQRCNFPSAGGSTRPALGAMQEPIPDFIQVYSKIDV